MRAALLLAATMLSVASPALAQVSDYDRAVELRRSDPAGAATLLERWLAEHPDDVDARVQLGYALLSLDRLDEAERQFAAVLDAAPDYTDARDGLALVAARRGATGEVRRGFALVEGALSDLENGQGDWHEFGGALSVPLGASDTLDARAHWFDRFGLEDVELGGQYTRRAGEDLWLRIGASATPSADFRPEIAVTAGFDARLAPSTVASLDASWQRFPLQDVVSLRPGVTQYLAGGRYVLALAGRAVFVEGDTLVGGSLRADWLPAPRTRAFVGLASGPETDLGVVSDTTSLYGGGEIPLSGDVSLLGSLAREWRSLGADRTEFRLGLKLAL
ncbi:YaiO family outer membrane beta-barrel protein [Aurantiacibacter luteus]|uniref:YaiO family outer membrane beta-barrel protein n=1 Tax=Aurantiacibacter luteus TaxID=1581420 RepID=UPI00069A133D|nr:YaiO family outer membrane beta-barrel protein [Aurantiacibacter luteus]